MATFLAPLQSNLLSDAEKKIAREYLKTEVKKMEENDEVTTSRNNNSQRNEGGDDHDDGMTPRRRRTMVSTSLRLDCLQN